MPVLSNPKHERFAQELAKGKSQVDAYGEAGYKPHDGAAARLCGNVRIQERVAEIQERAAIRAEITIAGLTESLMRLASKAEALQDASGFQASRASLMDAAKLNGLVVEKTDSTVNLAVKGIRRTVVDPRNPDA
jgi:hypothetical protein